MTVDILSAVAIYECTQAYSLILGIPVTLATGMISTNVQYLNIGLPNRTA